MLCDALGIHFCGTRLMDALQQQHVHSSAVMEKGSSYEDVSWIVTDTAAPRLPKQQPNRHQVNVVICTVIFNLQKIQTECAAGGVYLIAHSVNCTDSQSDHACHVSIHRM